MFLVLAREMVYRCCVTGCRGNYDTDNNVKIFRLPHQKHHPEERERWLRAIPRDNIPDGPNTFVCENHWPKGYETIIKYGKARPKYPPSVFTQCVAPSQVPTPLPPPRPTTKAHASSRNIIPDEFAAFLERDRLLSFEDLCQKVMGKNVTISVPVISYCIGKNELFVIQSTDFINESGIPRFLLKIKNNLSFEGFHCGVKCTVKPLSTNRIYLVDSVSRLNVAIHYLDSLTMDHKKNVISEQISSMDSLTYVGEKKYAADMIARAFEYFATSRSLYSRLRDDFELPSITLLTKLTSKVGNLEDNEFLQSYFQHCTDPRQRNVVLIIDEIYVKPQLSYQGGHVFGKAVDAPDHLATTVVSYMICSLFGGKKFLHKVLPVYRLDANFQYQQTLQILEGISRSGATTLAILCDNNRVNQSFFKKFELVSPWCTTEKIFLLFDYIHLIKSLRNNWITEKMQELKFSDNGSIKLAKWNDLKKLHDLERESLSKLSKLNDVAVSPKPIERQNVSICLKVFCDETVAALKSNQQLENVNDTVTFLSKFVKFF